MQWDLTNKQKEIVFAVLSKYGKQPARIIEASKGYRNISAAVLLQGGDLVNIMLFKREQGMLDTIRRTNKISNFVAERRIPARHTLSESIIKIGTEPNERYAGIYDYLPGKTMPWEAYTKAHIVGLGATLGNLHHLLHTYEDPDLPNIEDVCTEKLVKMSAYFSDPGVIEALSAKLRLKFDPSVCRIQSSIIESCKNIEGRQALHMDFVRSNILFDGQKVNGIFRISGVLDFEKAAVGHPLFDIARTLAFLFVDCKFKESEKVAKYFLDSGYGKRGAARLPKISVRMNKQNHDLLVLLMDHFLLYDLYKFLKHNPYESLKHNEHFTRTRDILIERNLLAVVPRPSILRYLWCKLLRKQC